MRTDLYILYNIVRGLKFLPFYDGLQPENWVRTEREINCFFLFLSYNLKWREQFLSKENYQSSLMHKNPILSTFTIGFSWWFSFKFSQWHDFAVKSLSFKRLSINCFLENVNRTHNKSPMSKIIQAKIDFLKWYLSVNSSEIYGKFRVFGPKKIKKINFSL